MAVSSGGAGTTIQPTTVSFLLSLEHVHKGPSPPRSVPEKNWAGGGRGAHAVVSGLHLQETLVLHPPSA